MNISGQRLHNHMIISTNFEDPGTVVSWFGAIQAQDFSAAKWAIGLRTKNQTDTTIENAFNEGKILRTHIMRPTWHFVHPSDIRWLLALTAPRVKAFNGHYYRKSGLDKTIFNKSNEIIQNALKGGKNLTRTELNTVLQIAKIPTQDMGLSYVMMQAELEGIICSGPRRGKQFTYMLLEERVHPAKEIKRDEALGLLTKRYFQSHGPAQIQDFMWWSGLTKTDAKRGIEILGSLIHKEEINDNSYLYINNLNIINNAPDNICLIPGFDEYFIAYKDRHDILVKKYARHLNLGGGMINGAIIYRGKMVGGWKRTLKTNGVNINARLFEKIPNNAIEALRKEVNRYGEFLALPVEIPIKNN
jgi:hypothetical protein